MKPYKFIHVLLLLILSFGVSACNQSHSQPSNDYLIFGWYFGECIGDCATLYKIEGGKLYVDNIDFPFESHFNEDGFSHRTERITFKKKALHQKYYNVAQTLLSNFPDELAVLDEQKFGMPDSYDQGGLYLETSIRGTRKVWTIDPADNFQKPKYVILYKKELIEVLNRLSSISTD